MTDGPIVIKVSIQKGTKKSYKAKQILTEEFVIAAGPELTKQAAMENFSRIWDQAHGIERTLVDDYNYEALLREVRVRNSNLKLVRE